MTCAVCYDDFEQDKKSVTFPCHKDHKFHESCAWNWLRIKINEYPRAHQSGYNTPKWTCPICRKLPTPDFMLKISKEHGDAVYEIVKTAYPSVNTSSSVIDKIKSLAVSIFKVAINFPKKLMNAVRKDPILGAELLVCCAVVATFILL